MYNQTHIRKSSVIRLLTVQLMKVLELRRALHCVVEMWFQSTTL